MTEDPGSPALSDDMRLLVDRVRDEAGLLRDVDAEMLARATVRALGTSIGAEQAGHLTASLPEELGAEITAHAPATAGTVDRDAFLDRVAAELPDDHDRAAVEREVHTVLALVRGWAPDGQIEGVLAQLPGPLAELFA